MREIISGLSLEVYFLKNIFMSTQGFMGAGATSAPVRANLQNGQMRAGALRQNLEERNGVKKEEPQEVIEEKISEISKFDSMDYEELKILAKEKGYSGKKLSRENLVKFLNSNS